MKGEPSVTQLTFRPNIVISGGEFPYFEDGMKKFRIGKAVFRRVRGCVRCRVITVDTEKGELKKSCEPLETLYQDRMDEKLGGPIFGANLCCDLSDGDVFATIKVGDELELIE